MTALLHAFLFLVVIPALGCSVVWAYDQIVGR